MSSPFAKIVPSDYPDGGKVYMAKDQDAFEAALCESAGIPNPNANGVKASDSNQPAARPPDPRPQLAWSNRAPELAKWAMAELFIRVDAYGRYWDNNGKADPFVEKHNLTETMVLRHFRATGTEHVIGAFAVRFMPILGFPRGGVCLAKWICIDIDWHGDREAPEANLRAALAWFGVLVGLGFRPLLIDSNGRGGYRLYVIFDELISAGHVRQLGRWLTRDWAEKGLSEQPEVFPKQSWVDPPGGKNTFGNWLRIPGRHQKRDHWSQVWDGEQFVGDDDAIDLILDARGDSAKLIPPDSLAYEAENLKPGTDREKTDRTEGELTEDAAFAREALSYLGEGKSDQHGREFVSNYELWLTIGMCLYELGDPGLELWEQWSEQSPKFQHGACKAKWDTFSEAGENGVGLGTLLWYATKAGRKGPWKAPTVSAPPTFDIDPRPITANLAPVPKIDPCMIPAVFRAWLQDIADRGCFPFEYVAAALIVVLSGLIGRKLAIRPKRYDDWTVVPNLWGAIIGPPGFLKTPAVEAVLRPLKRLVADAMTAHSDQVNEYVERQLVAAARKGAAKKKLEAAAKKENATDDELQTFAREASSSSTEAQPKCKRYLVCDFTVEKLGEILVENPNGLTVFRDELTGLLNTLNREGHQADRGFLLECWNGPGSYTFDRIERGTKHIPAACLALFGTIQPGPLVKHMKGAISGEEADGFIPRFQILVYPDPPEKYIHVDRWPDKDAKNEAYEVFKAIDQLNAAEKGCRIDDDSGIAYVNFAPDAQLHFDQWYTELQGRLRNGEMSDVMASHLAKYGSLMPSLSLIFHLVEHCGRQELGPVSLDAAEAATAWCDVLEAHARRVYLSCADGDISVAVSLAERIKESLPNPFTFRQVAQKGWTGLGSVDDARKAVGILEDRGWVKIVEVSSQDAARGGRPSEQVWINPKMRCGGEPEGE